MTDDTETKTNLTEFGPINKVSIKRKMNLATKSDLVATDGILDARQPVRNIEFNGKPKLIPIDTALTNIDVSLGNLSKLHNLHNVQNMHTMANMANMANITNMASMIGYPIHYNGTDMITRMNVQNNAIVSQTNNNNNDNIGKNSNKNSNNNNSKKNVVNVGNGQLDTSSEVFEYKMINHLNAKQQLQRQKQVYGNGNKKQSNKLVTKSGTSGTSSKTNNNDNNKNVNKNLRNTNTTNGGTRVQAKLKTVTVTSPSTKTKTKTSSQDDKTHKNSNNNHSHNQHDSHQHHHQQHQHQQHQHHHHHHHHGNVSKKNGVSGPPEPPSKDKIPMYIRDLYGNDEIAQLTAVSQLRILLSDEQKPPIDTVIESKCLPRILQLCENARNHNIIFEATWVLTNICSGTHEQTMAVIEQGGIECILNILNMNDPSVLEQAIWVLGNIAGDGTDARDTCLDRGVLDALIKLATHYNPAKHIENDVNDTLNNGQNNNGNTSNNNNNNNNNSNNNNSKNNNNINNNNNSKNASKIITNRLQKRNRNIHRKGNKRRHKNRGSSNDNNDGNNGNNNGIDHNSGNNGNNNMNSNNNICNLSNGKKRDDYYDPNLTTEQAKTKPEELELSFHRNFVWTISNLVRGKPQPNWQKVKKIIPVILSYLRNSDVEILTDTCWALSYLSDGSNDHIQEIFDISVKIGIDAIQQLVNFLDKNAMSVLVPALRTCGNIVSGSDDQTQEIIDRGLLKRLTELLKTPQHRKIVTSSVKKEAIWTISNITAGNRKQIEAVILNGLIEPLVGLLVDENAERDLVKECIWAISNATTGGSDKQLQYLAKYASVGLAKVMSHCPTDSKLQKVLLEGLDNLLNIAQKHPIAISENNIDKVWNMASPNSMARIMHSTLKSIAMTRNIESFDCDLPKAEKNNGKNKNKRENENDNKNNNNNNNNNNDNDDNKNNKNRMMYEYFEDEKCFVKSDMKRANLKRKKHSENSKYRWLKDGKPIDSIEMELHGNGLKRRREDKMIKKYSTSNTKNYRFRKFRKYYCGFQNNWVAYVLAQCGSHDVLYKWSESCDYNDVRTLARNIYERYFDSFRFS